MANVLINGRTAVHAGSGGTLTTIDVCLTKVGPPVIPIPYVNVARSADTASAASNITIDGNPVCHQSANFSKSVGDEPGNRKGIISGTTKGKATFITASPNVFLEGVPAVRQGDMMISNNRNTPPMPLMQAGAAPPPQGKVGKAHQRELEKMPDVVEWEVAGGSAIPNAIFGCGGSTEG